MSEHEPSAARPAHDAHEGHAGDHVVAVPVYLAVFAALMVLTIATVAASRVDLGPLNTPVALGIAVTKALLVILFFMHVKWSPRIIALVLAGAFVWLFHMIAGTGADYLSRGPVDPRPDQPVAPLGPPPR
jgi:cytochrome c oxidase subunit 4